MCALFGFLDYGKKVPWKTLQRLVQALANASEVRGKHASGIAYNHDALTIYKRPKPAHKMHFHSPHSMDRWAARYGLEKTGKLIMDKVKKGNTGRYAAINLCPYHTVEFRLFRGTLRLNTLLATLQLVNRICDTAMTRSEDEIGKQSWRDFVIGIEEPELIQYLKERQLYVNEEIESEEEQ